MTKGHITLVITGLGRCGTSLAMQLLDESGYRCHGEFPAYEEQNTDSHGLIEKNVLQKLGGRAVKIIDPHHGALDFTDCQIVYLERDLKEQAKSQIKFASAFFPSMASQSRSEARRMAKLLKRDNKKCLEMFKQRGIPVMKFRFEDLLTNPEVFINAIGAFTGCKMRLPVGSMTVIIRSPKCYPGFLELDLIGRK